MDVAKLHSLVCLPYFQNCISSFHLFLFIYDAFKLLLLIFNTEFIIRRVGTTKATCRGLTQIFPSIFLMARCVQIVK